MIEWAICNKCGHYESGEDLSRFCTNPNGKCNYMRVICSQGKDKEWEDERNSRLEWSDREMEQLAEIFSTPIRMVRYE